MGFESSGASRQPPREERQTGVGAAPVESEQLCRHAHAQSSSQIWAVCMPIGRRPWLEAARSKTRIFDKARRVFKLHGGVRLLRAVALPQSAWAPFYSMGTTVHGIQWGRSRLPGSPQTAYPCRAATGTVAGFPCNAGWPEDRSDVCGRSRGARRAAGSGA